MDIIQLIKKSPEYTTAKKLKNSIIQDPKLYNIVKNFQSKQDELYQANLPPKQMEDEMKKLINSFERMTSNTIIRDYSSALQQVQGTIHEINMEIIESIDNELSI
jgi:cell fate (sporulation/competence/biofilm development) regulator YlbF (YheA/YmcA/DUF963 family)